MPDGSIYSGELSNGDPHGLGKMLWADGRTVSRPFEELLAVWKDLSWEVAVWRTSWAWRASRNLCA